MIICLKKEKLMVTFSTIFSRWNLLATVSELAVNSCKKIRLQQSGNKLWFKKKRTKHKHCYRSFTTPEHRKEFGYLNYYLRLWDLDVYRWPRLKRKFQKQLRWKIWYHRLFGYHRTEPGSPMQECTFIKPQCTNVMVKIDL